MWIIAVLLFLIVNANKEGDFFLKISTAMPPRGETMSCRMGYRSDYFGEQ